MIKNNGLCATQPDPFADPVFQPHHPIKTCQNGTDLIRYPSKDGRWMVVNPCRNCGMVIAYEEFTINDRE